VSGTPIRVLIADDQALMRTGFRMILDAQDDIEVVGEAIDGPTRSGGSRSSRRTSS
jgi:DNA-binding NarL/FixJ family response regulator